MLRSFAPADAAAVQRLIHLRIDASYAGIYSPRAVAFFKEFHCVDGILERHALGDVLVVDEGQDLVATGAIVADEITGVFVHPRFQMLGMGRQVMDELENIARAVSVAWVGRKGAQDAMADGCRGRSHWAAHPCAAAYGLILMTFAATLNVLSVYPLATTGQ